MAYDDPGNVQTSRAELFKKWTDAEEAYTRDLIRASTNHFRSGRPPVHFSEAALRTAVDARTEADRAASDALSQTRDHGERDDSRASLETQTHGLHRPGIAAVTPARRAVKAALHETDGRSASHNVAAPPAKAG